MSTLFVYAVAAFGLAYIIGFSKISLPVRGLLAYYGDESHRLIRWPAKLLLDLIECPACLGFWIGLTASLSGLMAAHPLVLALFTSGSNFIIGRLTNLIEKE